MKNKFKRSLRLKRMYLRLLVEQFADDYFTEGGLGVDVSQCCNDAEFFEKVPDLDDFKSYAVAIIKAIEDLEETRIAYKNESFKLGATDEWKLKY